MIYPQDMCCIHLIHLLYWYSYIIYLLNENLWGPTQFRPYDSENREANYNSTISIDYTHTLLVSSWFNQLLHQLPNRFVPLLTLLPARFLPSIIYSRCLLPYIRACIHPVFTILAVVLHQLADNFLTDFVHDSSLLLTTREIPGVEFHAVCIIITWAKGQI